MSRRQAKIERKKKTRQLMGILLIVIFFLIIGIVSVDYALREMLALEDMRVLGYELEEENITLYIFGEEKVIDNEKIEEIYTMVEASYNRMREVIDILLERIKDVGKNRLFF